METITVKPSGALPDSPGISYEERRDISFYKGFDWSKGTKEDAVQFARALGFQETGMSVNEVGLLYDLLEKKGACNIVELGRNYGCSTRLFLQHLLRHGGSLQSWDLRHWPGFLEKMIESGYEFTKVQDDDYIGAWQNEDFDAMAFIKIAHSIKTDIENLERWVDFLLIDTEHGLEHALGEYMRWREYLRAGAMVAFHDSTLDGPKRAIEIIKEVEDKACGDRLVREYVNENVDGFGILVLEWKG